MLDEPLDLSFAPVTNPQPKRLSQAQISAFNEVGFVQPFEAFDASEIVELRTYIDRLIADMGEEGGYGINCYQARLAGLWDIATLPVILDHVEDLLGPNILCWATAVLSKKPQGARKVPWHQDAAFWKLTPARTVTVWLAIDDTDAENSAMRFIPRSHRHGALAIQATGEDSVFHQETAGADAMGEPFTNALKAGQFSMHADMLVHGSEVNRSNRRRCGFTLRYCPPEVRIVDPDWARGVEAILCRGEDPTGTWAHHERPDNDDITATASPHVIGNN